MKNKSNSHLQKLMYKILIFLFSLTALSQNKYPKDNFSSPLEIPLILSGSFGELRSNHFHSGLDIKTQGREGLKVKSIGDGYIYRIKISNYGYGKAIYIKHPNGYSSVYAHLKKFNDTLQKFIKQKQYNKEKYEIELFPSKNQFKIKKDELIGFSGNSGGSGGPHLHFEIRDNNERPVNPLFFGYKISDKKTPNVSSVYAYALNDSSYVGEKFQKIKLKVLKEENNKIYTAPIKAYGQIGIGAVAYDKQDYAYNSNGIYKVETYLNGGNNFTAEFNKFSFSETSLINTYIDYKHYKENHSRIQKFFIENGNTLSLIKNAKHNGILKIDNQFSYTFKALITDYANNKTEIIIPIEGLREKLAKKENITDAVRIYNSQSKLIEKENTLLYFPKGITFKDLNISIEKNGDTLKIHKDIIPLKKAFTITYNIEHLKDSLANKTYIARAYSKNNLSYINTKKEKNKLIAYSKSFGDFCLAQDFNNPTIKPINFKENSNLKNYRFLELKIEDNETGIKNYRATINGKWILMEYDYKTNKIIFDFNDIQLNEKENIFKIIVTDNVGNSSKFETNFYR